MQPFLGLHDNIRHGAKLSGFEESVICQNCIVPELQTIHCNGIKFRQEANQATKGKTGLAKVPVAVPAAPSRLVVTAFRVIHEALTPNRKDPKATRKPGLL